MQEDDIGARVCDFLCMTPTPHDALFKRTFSDPAHAAGELRSILPPALVARLDFDALRVESGSFVDEELSQRHADLLYAVPWRDGGEVLVYLLFEHQSTAEP
ncbi:MAG: Rpn family recombination-promoting nuclease/putative transposase [bacterium]